MINLKKAEEVFNYVEANGMEMAVKHYDIKPYSIIRYCQIYKKAVRERCSVGSQKQMPNILLFDIEVLPMWIRAWGLFKQKPNIKQIVQDWMLLSWAAKWLHSSEVMSECITPEEAFERKHERIVEPLWNLFDQADIIIAHNANRYDVRKMNSLFMIMGYKPPSPYIVIDTLKQSMSIAGHSSHKLDWIGKLIRNEGKIDTDYDLWIRCENGEQEALDYMLGYNKEDVALLEEAYLWMRPWMRSHPNLGLYMDLKESCCTICTSTDLDYKADDYYYTMAGKYATVRCNNCGGIGRFRTSALSNEESKLLIRSLAR